MHIHMHLSSIFTEVFSLRLLFAHQFCLKFNTAVATLKAIAGSSASVTLYYGKEVAAGQ